MGCGSFICKGVKEPLHSTQPFPAGRHDDAAAHLRAAAEAEDALVYGEPPEWTVPVRQKLGAVLPAARGPAGAGAAFRQNLDCFPENGWQLHGLAAALRAQDVEPPTRAALQSGARFGRPYLIPDVGIRCALQQRVSRGDAEEN
jgi:hypothetical protein